MKKHYIFAQLYICVHAQMNTEHLYNVMLNHACDVMCVHVQAVVIVVLIVFFNLVLYFMTCCFFTLIVIVLVFGTVFSVQYLFFKCL